MVGRDPNPRMLLQGKSSGRFGVAQRNFLKVHFQESEQVEEALADIPPSQPNVTVENQISLLLYVG